MKSAVVQETLYLYLGCQLGMWFFFFYIQGGSEERSSAGVSRNGIMRCLVSEGGEGGSGGGEGVRGERVCGGNAADDGGVYVCLICMYA